MTTGIASRIGTIPGTGTPIEKEPQEMFGVFSALIMAANMSPAAPAFHLDVALGDVSLQKVPFLIAAETGLYQKNGLDVRQHITPGAAKAAAANGVVVPAEYVAAEGEKAPITITGGAYLVAAVAQRKMPLPHPIIVATNENFVRDHIITRMDIRSPADLVGKRLGSGSNNVTGYDGVVYLERAGLTGKVTLVEPDSLAALQEGRVEAVMANLFLTAKAPELGLRDLVDVGQYNIPEAGSGVLVDPVWLSAHRDRARSFLKAMVEATRIMKQDKTVFRATLAKWFNVTDLRMVERLFLMAQRFPDKPYPAVEGVKEAMRVFKTDITAPMRPEDFYDEASSPISTRTAHCPTPPRTKAKRSFCSTGCPACCRKGGPRRNQTSVATPRTWSPVTGSTSHARVTSTGLAWLTGLPRASNPPPSCVLQLTPWSVRAKMAAI